MSPYSSSSGYFTGDFTGDEAPQLQNPQQWQQHPYVKTYAQAPMQAPTARKGAHMSVVPIAQPAIQDTFLASDSDTALFTASATGLADMGTTLQ